MRRHVREIVARDRQRAGKPVRLDETRDEPQQRRLAAAAAAEHGEQFAALDGQRQIVEHGARAEAHASDDRSARRPACPNARLERSGEASARLEQDWP